MPAAAQALWSAAQDALRGMLKTEIYSLWFAPIQPVSLKGETLTLGVADEFCEMWLKDNYLDLLRSVVSRAAVKPMALEFTVVAPLVATSPGTPAAPEVRNVVMIGLQRFWIFWRDAENNFFAKNFSVARLLSKPLFIQRGPFIRLVCAFSPIFFSAPLFNFQRVN